MEQQHHLIGRETPCRLLINQVRRSLKEFHMDSARLGDCEGYHF